MKIPFLMVRDDDALILGVIWHDDPDGGPVGPQHMPPPGVSLVPDPTPGGFSRAGHRDTEAAYLRAGVVEWVETASLDELRAERNAEINAWKLEANNTYFEFSGEQIAYGDSDRIEIQAVHNWVTLTGTMPTWTDWPAAWKAISNRWVPIPDVATWKAFTLAIAERGTAHFKRAQLLKASLAAAAAPAEIEAITW